MMRSGVTFPVLTDLLRGLFVEVAMAEILTDEKARTDSRISLVTGVHRKEVKRLRDLPPERLATPDVVTVSSLIIARWLAAAPYVDSSGGPRPLAKISEGGAAGPSFEQLVASVTTDIRSRAVLDDWLSQGLVTLDETDRVVLNVQAFVPAPGGAEQMFYFGRNLHDHVAAAVANISAAGAAPFLDRSVHYDGLTDQQAAELEAYARAEAARVLLEVNRKALALVEANGLDAASPPGAAQRRVNLGVFVYGDRETADDKPPQSAGSGAP
jgi:hypothetical protein